LPACRCFNSVAWVLVLFNNSSARLLNFWNENFFDEKLELYFLSFPLVLFLSICSCILLFLFK
jgi:hypothetical protein